MYSVEIYQRVRRSCHVEGMSEREAARQFGLHRTTIKKIFGFSIPPGYRRTQSIKSPKLDGFTGHIDAILAEMATKLGIARGPLTLAAVIGAVNAGGFASYKVTLIAANAVAKAVLGRGLAFGTNSAITRSVGLLAGPVGWAVTLLWTVFDLAGPAFRVTVPCVIQIAYMRQKYLKEKTLSAKRKAPK